MAPLAYAVENCSVLTMLLDKGADINAKKNVRAWRNAAAAALPRIYL
jgi:hypothetical protein